MVKLYSVLSVLLLCGFVCYGEEDSEREAYRCSGSAIRTCRSPSDVALRHLNRITLADENFFVEHCDNIIIKLECLIALNLSCPSSEYSQVPNFALIKGYVEELCDEHSQLKQDYVRAVTCLKEHENGIEETIENAESTIEKFMNSTRSPFNWEEGCVLFNFYKSELRNYIEENCGERTSRIYMEISEFLGFFLYFLAMK